ncbi:hypothetical protein JCGZ_04945 [Jatropha curcas]|uniref:Aminotransferase-like plant mobile domain-containing protein n=1 Tax=Jatropha curcas TaxID=180498 RepID=A0A067J9U6_JATCU|nr:hypothetical protein JCGZ_04945 [Jatropha curcas]
MCLLEGMTAEDREEEYEGSTVDSFLSAGNYTAYFSTRTQARLPEERKKHKTAAHYRAEAAAEAETAAAPAGSAGVVLGDVPFPPGMEVVLDPGLGLGSGVIIPADLKQAPPIPQLDPEHTTHVPAQRYLEICQRFGFARSFIAQLYSERHERRLRLVTTGSMNLNYVLYANLDRSMAYCPDKISCQYGMIQRTPRIHNFESGLMTPHLLTNLANRWQNRNTRYLDEGAMQDIVTPAYVKWFFSP